MLLIFDAFLVLHIICGATGAVSVWIPIASKKGGTDHRRWGRVFTRCMLITGSCAIGMSLLTLIDPMTTHPQLVGRFDAGFIRGIFGWMMLQMGILTVNLTWYGWLCISNRRDHAGNLTPLNLGLQVAVLLAAVNCTVQGWLVGQPLMMAISVVGVATGVTNLFFLLKPRRGPHDWLDEHIKALVGSGISVYTAFMAFGSVRIIPELALNPIMWAIPLTTGVSLILYHQRKVARQWRGRETSAAALSAGRG